MTLEAFFTSKWFTRMARLAMLVAVPALGYVGWTLTDVRSQQVRADNELASVQRVQVSRAVDGEAFQTEVRKEIDQIQTSLQNGAVSLQMVREDVATIKGLLLRDDAVATR